MIMHHPINNMVRPEHYQLSVIVPCYNEAEVLVVTASILAEVLKGLTPNFEILFINDGSHDNTLNIIESLSLQDSRFKGVSFSRNFGHQIAVTAGLDLCQGDAVVIIDADLQDPPILIVDMLQKWHEGYDVVYAKRKTRHGDPIFKKLCAQIFYRVLDSLSEISIPLDTGDYRLLDKRVVKAMRQMPERHRLLRGMAAWVGFSQVAVEFEREPRYAGETKYPFKRSLNLAIDGLMSFSVSPLRLVGYLGVFMLGLSSIGILYALFLRLFTQNWEPGWTILFITQLAFGGIQFMVMGVLGEYVGRIYTEAKQRPLYFLDQKFNLDDTLQMNSSEFAMASVAQSRY
jgi:polyisoprenyl-phosphate glycosyltransferase